MRATYQADYELAEDQMGYITTAQARAVGVQPMALGMMAKRGVLDRASHGVYRLVHFPVHPLAQLMQATLWPNEHRGVLSHETALMLHEMSDIDPAAVHITVPSRYRVQRTNANEKDQSSLTELSTNRVSSSVWRLDRTLKTVTSHNLPSLVGLVIEHRPDRAKAIVVVRIGAVCELIRRTYPAIADGVPQTEESLWTGLAIAE